MSSFLRDLIKPFSVCCGAHYDEDLEKIAAEEPKLFRYEILAAATRNFDPCFKLGEGGFGPVYKGNLDDGREIAVKKLSQSSNQGKKEFMNEAKLLTCLRHRNVIKLLGFCAHGTERLLVYEYAPNESLDKILFSPKSHMKKQLDWKKRFDIIIGIASSLRYLHGEFHDRIIHCDIKASNVLLDDKWVPKIAGFGMACLFPEDQTLIHCDIKANNVPPGRKWVSKIADFGLARLFPEDQIQLDTRVVRSRGYMDPQYILHGDLSEKTDVYSFGVLVLELITGQQNSVFSLNMDARSLNLLDWAHMLYGKGQSLEIMDPRLADSAVTEEVALCFQLGLLCTQGEPHRRPSMERAVSILLGQQIHMEEPMRPGP